MAPEIIADPVTSRCLVIGTGIAGLQFALLAAAHGTVQVVTKKDLRESNTNYAQGGIAAAVSPLDDFELHVQDTVQAGDGLCRTSEVRAMVEAGPELIDRLVSYGVRFSREEDGAEASEYALGREGGHSCRRVLHCRDLTGREIENRLLAACEEHPNVTLEADHMGLELLTGEEFGLEGDHAGRIVGALVLDRRTLGRRVYLADMVVLATGGCGKVYSYTSNPDIATGDGLAMAYRAGAEIRNLEFVQFHPTCLYHPQAKSFLISEAVRGEGAVLINHRQERFMQRYHPLADLAPRDVVARSIDREMKTSGDPCAFLDLRHLDRDKIEARFPHLVETCARFGIDMAGEPVPVVPAAHYMCGGVAADHDARTSLPGLFAIGEVACSGVHGANRLASNSLLEAVYYADRAAGVLADEPRVFGESAPKMPTRLGCRREQAPSPEVMVLEHDWDLVRRIMWDYVGIVREKERLDIALQRLRAVRATVEQLYGIAVMDPAVVELRNISLLGELIVLCALDRHESRGLHYTLDHPAKLDVARDTVLARGAPHTGDGPSEPNEGPSG